jgi:hypothetical protein
MTDTVYKTVRAIGYPFRFRVSGLDHIQNCGPAIFISNHAGSTGPIAVILSIPLRFHLWAIAEMADFTRAPRYIYHDFVQPAWHLSGRFGMLVAYLVTRISVNLINQLGSLSVDRNRGWCSEVFYKSLALLQAGQNLLIFPEDPILALDPETKIRPFCGGYLWLCQMYHETTDSQLPVYPIAVYPPGSKIGIGQPVFFEFKNDRRHEIRLYSRQLQESVVKLYQSLENTQ